MSTNNIGSFWELPKKSNMVSRLKDPKRPNTTPSPSHRPNTKHNPALVNGARQGFMTTNLSNRSFVCVFFCVIYMCLVSAQSDKFCVAGKIQHISNLYGDPTGRQDAYLKLGYCHLQMQ